MFEILFRVRPTYKSSLEPKSFRSPPTFLFVSFLSSLLRFISFRKQSSNTQVWVWYVLQASFNMFKFSTHTTDSDTISKESSRS